jgi:magnesium chelatase family protein
MIALAYTATTLGVEGHIVAIEADSSPGTPAFTIIGLPDRALGESRDRVRAAIINSGFLFPAGRLLVNLSPADIRKTGMGFDLPLALALLAIDAQITPSTLSHSVAIGELALDGAVRPVSGVLAMVLAARQQQYHQCIVPFENAAEAALVDGIDIYAVRHLAEAVSIVLGHGVRYRYERKVMPRIAASYDDFADVRGQLVAKRAFEIAAAGGHHLSLCGPPGCGKTMLARRMPSILPLMDDDEVLTTTAIRSAAGVNVSKEGLQYARPFRAPHHTITQIALLGGGRFPQPGEVSLAHHGVLFLDEFPEFTRATLETLRQPLEEGVVTVTRSAGAVAYPARFNLVVAMNPCPCGMRGERQADCRCSDVMLQRYASRLSGPLLDRIDLRVRLARLPSQDFMQRPTPDTSAMIRARVQQARQRQYRRYGSYRFLNANAQASVFQTPEFIETRALQRFVHLCEKLKVSARGFDRILRIARTIADLAERDQIGDNDVSEALSYR